MDPNIKNLSLIMEITQFKEDISQNEILQVSKQLMLHIGVSYEMCLYYLIFVT